MTNALPPISAVRATTPAAMALIPRRLSGWAYDSIPNDECGQQALGVSTKPATNCNKNVEVSAGYWDFTASPIFHVDSHQCEAGICIAGARATWTTPATRCLRRLRRATTCRELPTVNVADPYLDPQAVISNRSTASHRLNTRHLECGRAWRDGSVGCYREREAYPHFRRHAGEPNP